MSTPTTIGSIYWSQLRREHPLEVSMLLIRPAVRTDVSLIKTLIHEMGEYERLPVLITEETLAHDGFGPRQEFRVLIADWDSEPAGYAFFFNCYSTFRGSGLFLEDLFAPTISGKEGWRRSAFACRSRRSARGVFWDHAECAGVESTRD